MQIITGAAGFIGSSYLNKISPIDEPVIAVDFIPHEKKHHSSLPIDYVKIDLTSEKEVYDLIDKYAPTKILHLAAISKVGSPSAIRINVKMTKNIFIAVDKLSLETKPPKIVMAGSAAEYGDIRSDEIAPDEFIRPRPMEPYAESKVICARMAEGYRRLRDIPTTILRFANVYGPGQTNRLIPTLIKNILEGNPLILHGFGHPTRQWIYVDDVCEAIDKAFEDLESSHGAIFNIGHPHEVPIRTLAEIVAAEVQDQCLKMDLVLPPAQFDYKSGGGGAQRVAMDVTRAKRTLRFAAKTGLEEGVRHTVAAFLKEYHGLHTAENIGRDLVEAKDLS